MLFEQILRNSINDETALPIRETHRCIIGTHQYPPLAFSSKE